MANGKLAMDSEPLAVREACAGYQLATLPSVPPGYKQTEVGVIPDGWDAKSMGSLTSLMTNGFVGTVTNEYVDSEDGVLYVQGYNVEENGFNFHGIKRVSKVFHARNQKSCLRGGDLLTIQTGDIGVTTIVPASLAGANCHALVISRFDQRVSDPGYYCQYFNSERGRSAFKEIETGSTMKHLNVGDMVKLVVPSPSLPEQRAIAAALSDVDALLAKLDQFIAKKRDLKQAAMQQLLTGQNRLPGFSGEWKGRLLGEVITHCFSGATPYRERPEFYEGNIRWITSGELNYNVISDTVEKISSEAVARTNLKIVPKGTFLMAITGLEAEGTRGSCGIVGAPSATNQSCMAVFPTSELLTEYLFHYYVFKGKTLALQYCQGTKQQSYTAKLVKLLPIFLPPATEEQHAIATVLSDMDAELAALEARRNKTRAIKQGMMQELLTGRIRLVERGKLRVESEGQKQGGGND